MRHEEHAVNGDPDKKHRAKRDEKFPTASELGYVVGESLAECELLFKLFANVAGKDLMLLKAFDDFFVERGKFPNLLLQDFFYVILAELAQIVETDEPLAVHAGPFLLDELEKRRPNQLRHHSAVW